MGLSDAAQPRIVNDHDFTSSGHGTVIPHGIYDLAKNEASVHLNCSKDTAELACDRVELRFNDQGRKDYPDVSELLFCVMVVAASVRHISFSKKTCRHYPIGCDCEFASATQRYALFSSADWKIYIRMYPDLGPAGELNVEIPPWNE